MRQCDKISRTFRRAGVYTSRTAAFTMEDRHGDQRSRTMRANAPNRACAATIRPAAPISPSPRLRLRREEQEVWRLLCDRQTQAHRSGSHTDPISTASRRSACSTASPISARSARKLREFTGWEIVAVPGLIPAGPFFEHLANRRFPVTNWLRTARRARLHRRTRHVPRLLRPCADPDPAGLRRFHAALRREGGRSHSISAAAT